MTGSFRWRELARSCVPPLVVDLLRGRRPSGLSSPPIWEGIYPHRRDVPGLFGRYDAECRLAEFAESTREMLRLQRSGRQAASVWHDALGLLAASLEDQREIRVLDFGGALGAAFVQLLCTLRGPARVVYHVVELEGTCRAGRELFAGDDRIAFHTEVPALTGLHIVYSSSVLPYVDDYGGLLRGLTRMGAAHVLLTQLAIGRFPTFAARQLNLSGQAMAYWFINRDELVGVMEESGYALAFETQAGPPYPQDNYPESHRVGRMWNLLFRRKANAATPEA